jgi:hypothetical protein
MNNMKNQRWMWPVLIVLFAAIGWVGRREWIQSKAPQAVHGLDLKDGSANADAVRSSKRRIPESRSQMKLTAVKYDVDPVALARDREDPPFEFRGDGTSGRVIDSRGNVLMESGEQIGIFGVEVGPDRKKVLVRGGDAINLVLDPSAGRKIKLPSFPPGANMLAISDWHWIGSDLLFGSSGVHSLDNNGKAVTSCEGNNVAKTKFYTFDLVTEKLSELAMPGAVTQPVVHAVDVMSDGHVHLVHEEAREGSEQDLGWFKIETSQNPE